MDDLFEKKRDEAKMCITWVQSVYGYHPSFFMKMDDLLKKDGLGQNMHNVGLKQVCGIIHLLLMKMDVIPRHR
jgi:hypothetical protein